MYESFSKLNQKSLAVVNEKFKQVGIPEIQAKSIILKVTLLEVTFFTILQSAYLGMNPIIVNFQNIRYFKIDTFG